MVRKALCVVIFLAVVSMGSWFKCELAHANEPEYGPRPPVGFGRQEKKDRGENLHKRDEIFANISKRLNLNEKQQVKVRAILEDSRKEAMEIIKSSKEKLVNLKDKTNKQVKSLLSKDQQAEFDKMIEEGKARAAKWLAKSAKSMKARGLKTDGQEVDAPPMPPEGDQED